MQEEIDYLVNERVTKLVREIHSQENSKFEKLQQKFQNCSVSKVIFIHWKKYQKSINLPNKTSSYSHGPSVDTFLFVQSIVYLENCTFRCPVVHV